MMHRGTKRDRVGGAAIELAVCLPTVFLLVFGSIECCSMIYLEQTLTVCSYEGSRAAIRYHAANGDVMTACNQLLNMRKVKNATITLVPPDVSTVMPGSRITVKVSAPTAANSWMPTWFFSGRNLVATCTMVKE